MKVRDEVEQDTQKQILRRLGILEDRAREMELRIDYGIEVKEPINYGGTD